MFGGLPDIPRVIERRRQLGIKVGDREARRDAGTKLWEAIDRRDLHLVAFGGRPRKKVALDPDITNSIPQMRNPEVGSLTYLRPSNPHYQDFVAWFGQHLEEVTLAVRELELHRLARKLMRTRRKNRSTVPTRRGRPSTRNLVRPLIEGLIDAGTWNSTQSVKALTRLVNKQIQRPQPISEDTVARELDQLQHHEHDRRFARLRRKRSR
jgi:hypothetical protein